MFAAKFSVYFQSISRIKTKRFFSKKFIEIYKRTFEIDEVSIQLHKLKLQVIFLTTISFKIYFSQDYCPIDLSAGNHTLLYVCGKN
jgi:hypothetical protein